MFANTDKYQKLSNGNRKINTNLYHNYITSGLLVQFAAATIQGSGLHEFGLPCYT